MSDIETEALAASGVEPHATKTQEVKQEQKVDGHAVEDGQKSSDEVAAEKAGKEKKPNPTTRYIGKLKDRIGGYEAQWSDAAALESRLRELREKADGATAPKPEDFDFQQDRYFDAALEHRLQQRERDAEIQQLEHYRNEVLSGYFEREAEFVSQTPDYNEKINAIPPALLPDELKLALISHERGPEVAYYLANNMDELYDIARGRPELFGYAVERLSKRLTAPQQSAPEQNKPITKAPPPPAMVSGRSPSEVPDEKLTDEQWFARERERDLARRR